jgi:hypothetical protein
VVGLKAKVDVGKDTEKKHTSSLERYFIPFFFFFFVSFLLSFLENVFIFERRLP